MRELPLGPNRQEMVNIVGKRFITKLEVSLSPKSMEHERGKREKHGMSIWAELRERMEQQRVREARLLDVRLLEPVNLD